MFHVFHMIPGQVSCSFRRTTFGLVKQGVQAGLPEVYLEHYLDLSIWCSWAYVFWLIYFGHRSVYWSVDWFTTSVLFVAFVYAFLQCLELAHTYTYTYTYSIHIFLRACFQVGVHDIATTRWFFLVIQMMSSAQHAQRICWKLIEVLVPWRLEMSNSRVQENLRYV